MEKKVIVKDGITEVGNKLVLQAHESFTDFPEKEFLEISEKYLGLLFKKATKSKREVKMPTLKAEALIVSVLGLSSAEALSQNFRKIKKTDELISTIHQATKIAEIDAWLKNQKFNAEAILQNSGIHGFYKDLYDFSFTDQTTHLFKSLEAFNKTVVEIFDWFKLVKILNDRSKASGINDRLVNDFFKFSGWNKDKIYYTFIIGVTLGTGNFVFSLNDLLKFSLIIQKEGWVGDFEAKLSLPDTGNDFIEQIYSNGTFKGIINLLKDPKNQNITYFVRKVNIHRNDYKTAGDLDKIINQSLLYANQELRLERVNGEAEIKRIDLSSTKSRMEYMTKRHKAESIYKMLMKRPYLVYWFSREEIARMMIIDSKNNYELKSKIEGYTSNNDLKEILRAFNSKESVADILHTLMRKEKIFGYSFQFFSENRSKKITLPIDSVQSVNLFKRIIALLCHSVSLKHLSLWLSEIEKSGEILSLDHINVHKLTAHLCLLEEGQVSKSVLESLKIYPWFKYLTPEILNSIRKKLKT